MMLPNIISGQGIFTWISDYNMQSIPFDIRMNEIVRSGTNTLWEPINDLGTSTIGSYSFYNIASPFTLVLYLFPAQVVPYLMSVMYILKYGVAGLTAFMFLSRMIKTKKAALLGSLFYAFSGFTLTVMQFHFHDSIALFPLLLYALDRLIKDDKRIIFILVVALNLFTNYIFFIGEVIFILIYYIILNVTKYYDFTWKKFFQIILEGLIGVGLGCIILVPSLLFIISNPRVGKTWNLASMFIPSRGMVMELIRAFILPNDSMTYHSVIFSPNWSSVEIYLPFVGSVLWLSYLFKKPNDPFSILAITFCVIAFVPVVNSIFMAFSNAWYCRWFYMFTLILALLSAKAIEVKASLKPGFTATGILFILLLALAVYDICQGGTFIHDEGRFIVVLLFFALNLFCLSRLNTKYLFKGVFLGTCLYIIIYGNYNCLTHQDYQALSLLQEESELLQSYDSNVRYNCDHYNGPYFAQRMAATSWNSNTEGSAFEFYDSIGIQRTVASVVPLNNFALNDFLSVKYIIVNGQELTTEEQQYYSLAAEYDNFTIYENSHYLPFGIDYTSYITDTEFAKLNTDERQRVLKDAVVLSDAQAAAYQDFLSPYQGQSRTSHIAENNFSLTQNGFQSDLYLEQESLVVYTFAFSDNFEATVNGLPAQLEKVDNGLIGIKLNSGENHLEVTYRDKGLKIGAIISGVSLVALIGYSGFVFYRKRQLLSKSR